MFARSAVVFALLLAVPSWAAEPAKIEITDAWARASGGLTQSAAVYVTISNRSPNDDRLIQVSTPAAKMAHIHQEEMGLGNVMRMRMVEGIDVAAGKTVKLAPGGYHVMLMDLERPLVAGQHIALTLRFVKAGEATVNVAVQPIGASGPPTAQGHPRH